MPIPREPLIAVDRRSLREHAVCGIREAIYDGTLQPGELLLDAELQGWLGCSRTPIREALNDLASVGLVEIVPQRHTRVATPDERDRTFVFQTLGALVGGVVRVTVPTLDDSGRTRLVDALDAIVGLSWPLVDTFVELCPNEILVHTTRDLIGSLAHQLRMTAASDWLRWPELDRDFPVLRDAVASGDAIAAELAVERLFRLSIAPNAGDEGSEHG